MTLKQYRLIKIITTIIIAVIFSQSLIYKNFVIPVIVLAVTSLLLIVLRRKVREIIADERDCATSGQAARVTIQIYAWCAVVGMLALYAWRDLNPVYETLAATLAYTTCALMFIYSLIFHYYNHAKLTSKKFVYTAFIIAIILAGIFVTLRFFSGEDGWICQNGQWITHGHPDFSAPAIPCK